MTCIALDGFYVTAAELQLQRSTAVPQTVKNNSPEIVLLNEILEHFGNHASLKRSSVFLRDHNIVILVFRPKVCFQTALYTAHLDHCVSDDILSGGPG